MWAPELYKSILLICINSTKLQSYIFYAPLLGEWCVEESCYWLGAVLYHTLGGGLT